MSLIFERFPISGGMDPLRKFSDKYLEIKVTINCWLSNNEKCEDCRSYNVSRLTRLKISKGIDPIKPFVDKYLKLSKKINIFEINTKPDMLINEVPFTTQKIIHTNIDPVSEFEDKSLTEKKSLFHTSSLLNNLV
jgi:hypothetical protein